MADKSAKRGIYIYIDGKEVSKSVRGIEVEMRALSKEQKNMKIGSEEYVAAGKKIAQLKTILQQHKDYQKEISKEYNNMQKGASKYFGSFQVLLGNIYTKGISLLISGLGDAVNKIRSFEKANVVLAGILGENKNDIKDLSTSAIELGKTSKYTASQVTELQTELAKLGFSRQEIKESQKYVLDFATALDASLGEAASLAGSSLRAFGAETTETERYVSAMTVAANRSALSFEYLSTAMPIVAPVAKAFNFTIEDTLALLGNLSDSGFDASMAATSLRNILLNLADSNGKLAKSLGRPVTNLDELVKGFKDLRDKGVDLATALELTDKRSVAAFQTFLQGADKLVPLRDSLIDVGGELEKIANDQMDNLDGSILNLESSWEALMLAFSNSSGPMKKVVDFLTLLVDKAAEAVDAMGKLQNSQKYAGVLNSDYEHAIEVQRNIITKRKSEGMSPEEAYSSQTDRYSSILGEKMNDLEKVQKQLDEWEKKKSVWTYINPLNASTEKELRKAYDVAQYEVDRVKQQLKAIEDLKNEEFKVSTDTDDDNDKKKPKGNGTGDKSAVQRKKMNDALRQLEEQHLSDLSKIKQDYLNGDILSEQAYNDKILEQQSKYDETRKKKLEELQQTITDFSLRIDIAKQIADIEAKALDRQIADKSKKQKAAAKQEQDLLKWNEEETKKIIDASLKYVATEEDKAYIEQMKLRADGTISEAQYQKELTNIQMRYLEERLRINGLTEEQIAEFRKQLLEQEVKTLQDTENKRKSLFGDDMYLQLTEQMKTIDDALLSGAVTFGEAIMLRVEAYMDAVNTAVQLVGNNLSGAMDNLTSAEESKISRKYDKEIAAAEGNSKKQKKLEEQKQKDLNAIKAKYADKQFAVSVAQTISSTSVAAMEAYKAMAGIPVIGPALGVAAAASALAYGASQIKVAKEQRDAAKEGYYKGGYYIDGGYTGGGDPKQVRGYLPDGSPVHGKEFIANHATTSLFRPLFDVMDEAQKHNTVSSISKRDLAKALNIPTGYYQGGYNGSASSPAIVKDTGTDEAYERLADILERLDQKMDTPFRGYVTYKGDDGIEDAEILNNKMMKNVSR